MLDTAKQILAFITKPDYNRENVSFKDKFKVLFSIYALSLLCLFFVGVIKYILIQYELLTPLTNKTFENVKYYSDNETTVYYLGVLMIVPLYEELSFRLMLFKFDIKKIIISISLILGIIFYMFLHQHFSYSLNTILNIFLPYIYMVIISTLLYIIMITTIQKLNLNQVKYLWDNNFYVIFYTIAFLFSILHLYNLNLSTKDYLFTPVILLPFIIYAIFLGYTRIKLGFTYSVILHLLLNAPAILIKLFTS